MARLPDETGKGAENLSFYAAAIVPAYNEGPRVGSVLEEILESGLFKTVVAVDDGSTDETFNEILAHPVVPVRHPENRGKGAALQSGLELVAEASAVAFIDSDLLGLRAKHLHDLLTPIAQDSKNLMTVARLTGRRMRVNAAQRWFSILNGQRALSRSFLDELPDLGPFRFGVEVFMSRLASDLGPGEITVPWQDVTHVMKEEKYGLLRGFAERMKMYSEVLTTYYRHYPRWYVEKNRNRILRSGGDEESGRPSP